MKFNDSRDAIVATRWQPERLMILVGVVALTLGVLIYVFDRPAAAVYFVPDSWRLAEATPLLFGTFGNYLPAFLHALAFALFINAIAGRRHIALMCIGWFVAESIFELAQIDVFASGLSAATPYWFAEFPILENVASHFLTGYFDGLDVVFLMLGCATAYAIGYRALPRLNSGQLSQPRTKSRANRLARLLLVVFVGLTSIVSSGGTGNVSPSVADRSFSLSYR